MASGAIVHATSNGVCSEPIGVLVSADDARLFVACAQDDEVVELAAADLSLVATVPCPRKPWALAWASDGTTLLATHLLGPGVSALPTAPLALTTTWTLADGPAIGTPSDPTEPHGPVRGIYDAAVRPGTSELWVAHLMLGIDTPQPDLDFKSTVFPALTILGPTGSQLARLSVRANPGDGGAFGDVVSGPRAIAFSGDGGLAFIADTDSEDVLIVDTAARVEAQLIRPLPGHLPEGIVWAAGTIYVQERNSEDVAAFTVSKSAAGIAVAADGVPIPTLGADPMPATLRLGQKLFYTANSDDVPVTQNHWVACASCHVEGRSDAVTWKFAQGPRDTPTNAGGVSDTGFLFRTADRNQVQDYWKTINVEQGGHFSITDPTQKTLLDAIAAFVNDALPAPVPPSTDGSHALTGSALAALRTKGEAVFGELGCGACHGGPAKTDSGLGQRIARSHRPGRRRPNAGRGAPARRRDLRSRGRLPGRRPHRHRRRRARRLRVRHPGAARPHRLGPLPARRQRGDARRRRSDHAAGDGRRWTGAAGALRGRPASAGRVPAQPLERAPRSGRGGGPHPPRTDAV